MVFPFVPVVPVPGTTPPLFVFACQRTACLQYVSSFTLVHSRSSSFVASASQLDPTSSLFHSLLTSILDSKAADGRPLHTHTHSHTPTSLQPTRTTGTGIDTHSPKHKHIPPPQIRKQATTTPPPPKVSTPDGRLWKPAHGLGSPRYG